MAQLKETARAPTGRNRKDGTNLMHVALREKRRSLRYPVDQKMQIILQGRAIPVRLVNVSDRGAGMLIASESFDPRSQALVILRCEVAGEIIDVSMQIRHSRKIEGGLYVGAEVITNLQTSLTEYIRNHNNLHEADGHLDRSLSQDFLQQILVETKKTLAASSTENLNKQDALDKLAQNHWVSYIGLSSQILTTRIYLSYNVVEARKFAGMATDAAEQTVHDYMREKTNVIAGSIKRWVLAHRDVDDATCGNFRVRMPCTEPLDEVTCCTLKKAQHGLMWKARDAQGQEILCCAFLQIDDEAKAASFLRLLTESNLDDDCEIDDIEFL